MSVIYVEVGYTSWTRAWVCDFCGTKKERVPTGKREACTGPTPPEDDHLLRYEYDGEQFEGDDHPFRGWTRVERVSPALGPEQPMPGQPAWHLCPKCGPALLDLLWSKCAPPTETTEAARNVVITRPFQQSREPGGASTPRLEAEP